MIELCKQETHIARKVHKCSLCNGDILPKTKYYEIITKCDGQFCDDKYHILLNDFCKDNKTNEFYIFEVEDYYKDKNCYNCINEKKCAMSTKQCLRILNNKKETEKKG